MPDFDLIAEAKHRTQKANPSLTDEQWATWLAAVAVRGGRVVLTLDGCLATYEIKDASATPLRVSNQETHQ